jgi:hypothetical protein
VNVARPHHRVREVAIADPAHGRVQRTRRLLGPQGSGLRQVGQLGVPELEVGDRGDGERPVLVVVQQQPAV